MSAFQNHIRLNKIKYAETTSNVLIYLSHDVCSGKTELSDCNASALRR